MKQKLLKINIAMLLLVFTILFCTNVVLAADIGDVDLDAFNAELSENLVTLLDASVEDALYLASQNINDLTELKSTITTFDESRKNELWFNIGSDDNPLEQRELKSLYKEITFIDASGMEIIKFKDNVFSNDLKDISLVENTEFKSENYFAETKSLLNGKVHISKLLTNYLFKEDVFRNSPPEVFNDYDALIARDIKKEGAIRFSSPIYEGDTFVGMVIISLDYKHIQEIFKHVDPMNDELILSATYGGNYVLVFDVAGNTIVHPKPDNIVGYLDDGLLAGYNEPDSLREGSIFNLYKYTTSPTYPEMAQKVLVDKEKYTSSATDVSGRTKLTVAVPLLYSNQKTNYAESGIFGGMMLSIQLTEPTETQHITSVRLLSIDYPPYYGPDLEGRGFITEIIEKAFERRDYDVEIEFTSWSEALEKTQSGEYDGLYTLWYREDREEFYKYSAPLPANELVFCTISNIDLNYDSYEDLKDYTIGVVEGYTYPSDFLEADLDTQKCSDDADLISCLFKKNLDIILIDKLQAKYLANKYFPEYSNSLSCSKKSMQVNLQYIGFSKKAPNYEVKLSDFNKGLNSLISDGTYEEILEKHGYGELQTMFDKEIMPSTSEELVIQLKAKEVAKQIENYILHHHDFTMEDLQKDLGFRELAVQIVGTTGYTAIYEAPSGIMRFHPNHQLENEDVSFLKEDLPDWWTIYKKSLNEVESAGSYAWLEADGSITEKYMATVPVKIKVNNVTLIIAATTYLREISAETYLKKYDVEDMITFKQATYDVKQQAINVAEEINKYLRIHPTKTFEDLKNDSEFQKIAVQLVGKTGYTAVTNYDSLEVLAHKNDALRGVDLHTLSSKLPGFWNIMSKTQGGHSAFGTYNWQEPNGQITKKYMYVEIVNTKTADGIGLHVAATTYLNEYAATYTIRAEQSSRKTIIYYVILIFLILIILIGIYTSKYFAKTKVSEYDTKIIAKRKISVKILISFLIISLIPLLSLGSLILYLDHSVSQTVMNEISSYTEENIHKDLDEKLHFLERDIVDRMTTFDMLFRQMLLNDNLVTVLNDADKTAIMDGEKFYPLEKNTQWNELQTYFLQSYDDLSVQTDALRLFHKNGYVVNGVVLGEEDTIDYKGDKSWFKDVMDIEKTDIDDIYISPISIARRTDSPAIRYVAPVEYKGERLGLFIANFKSKSIIEEVEQFSLGLSGSVMLVDFAYENAEGNILDWPVILANSLNPKNTKIDESDPYQLPFSYITTSTKGHFDLHDEYGSWHIHYIKLDVENEEWYLFITSLYDELHLPIITTTNALNYITNVIRSSLLWFIIVILIILIGTYFFITKTISSPLVKLHDLATDISQGNFKTRTHIKTKDELQNLGDVLNKTAEILDNREIELKALDKMKTEFLSITSHELRSPMTPMRGQLQLLLEGYVGKLNKKQREALNIVVRNTERLDGIISDFLELSRIEAARLKFNFKRVSLNSSIKMVIEEMEQFLPEKNIKIEITNSKLPIMEVDPDRVMQVFRNIVSNALKFTPENGKINIYVGIKDETILFSIKDTGVGLNKKDMLAIFQPFTQIDNMYQHQSGGTGLGLSISRGIVESQKGEIWVESQGKNRGTTFYFTIPFKPTKETEPIKLLFSSQKDYALRLEPLFQEFLGPYGSKELNSLKNTKELNFKTMSDYVKFLNKKDILNKHNMMKFKREINLIYGRKIK